MTESVKGQENEFVKRLVARQEAVKSRLCVGLDPDPKKMPTHVSLGEWTEAVVAATAQFACCFKPNLAFWACRGATHQLKDLLEEFVRPTGALVIIDGKRGDIGNTAEMYAKEVFGFYGGDAATVNPYLGWDGIAPFAEYDDAKRGVFVLCLTSNRSAPELQGSPEGRDPLFLKVATEIAERRRGLTNLGLVVGATHPEGLWRARAVAGAACPILIPGVGRQGGDVVATLEANAGGLAVVNSSSAIVHASSGFDFAEAAAEAAEKTRDLLLGGAYVVRQ